MRCYLCFLPILLFSIELTAQQSIVVDLSERDGIGPFQSVTLLLDPLKQQPTGYIRPAGLSSSAIYSFNFQSDQSYLWNYRSGKISKTRYRSYVEDNNVDSTLLTDKIFSNKLFILVGIDSSLATVVIPDSDDDHSFLNEKPLIFRRITNKKESIEARAHPELRQLEYNYFNGKTIERRKADMRFTAYQGDIIRGKGDSLNSKPFLAMGLNHYREGIFKIKNRSYKVASSNGFTDGGYTRGNSRFVFTASQAGYLPEKEGNVPYKLGDVVSLEGEQFRIDSMNFITSKLYLTYLGFAEKPVGHLEGNYLPAFKGITIDSTNFDLNHYKGNYVLIDFWGTWCGPCIEAMPRLVEIKKTFEKKGLVVIGVAYDYDRKKVNDFVIRKGIDWIQVFQSRRTPRQNALIDKLKVFHYPTTFLIGKDGKILLRDRKLEEIENELRKLL